MQHSPLSYQNLQEAADYISGQITSFRPEFGIILGTGLGGLVNDIEIESWIAYDQIPHFPLATVESHTGRLVFGRLAGRRVVVMQGRFHYYEGYHMAQVVMPVRVMKLLGITRLFISNAAGGLNPGFELSDLMLLTDHINLLPSNPLIGPNIDELGPRFPDMMETYDPELLQMARQAARNTGLNLLEGVYASVPGPMLETPSEYRYLSIIGADAVGMSTVPEAIAARHMGLPVMGVSVITDLCAPGKLKKVHIADVLAAAAAAEPRLRALMREMVALQPVSEPDGQQPGTRTVFN